MPPAQRHPKKSFFKEHVLPVLFIFLIPVFSAWFFSYAEHETDSEVLGQVETNVRSDSRIPEVEKPKVIDFYRANPVSAIMASNTPKAVKLQAMFEPVRTRYSIFRWMKLIAWTCLATIAATFVIVGVSVAFSFRSQSAQYYALRIGWPVLRTSAAIQVIGQGTLAVALSFWVTAIFTHSYYVKLVAVIGILAICAVLALLKAIFAKVNNLCEVAGELVSEAEAPGLWQRVRDMAAKLHISPPDRIIVGIDPNFFVTEHPVKLEGKIHTGRTLFLSLPMLKVLNVDEADSVLGHELAHFSGNDTLWSRKISPLTGKFALYLRMLGNGLSLGVAHFMLFFWKLYGLSMRRLSREREFRADKVGAELVSREAVKRALIKVSGYCEYRARTERAVLEKQRVDKDLRLSQEIEQGFPTFLNAFTSKDDAINEKIPHPFDSHPPLHNRLERLGFDARASLLDPELHAPVQNSWHQAISTAPELEAKMWAKLQEAIQAYHSRDLAWRLLPKDEEEKAIVLGHFPKLTFRNKKGAEATLEYDRIHLAEWAAPILFGEIVKAVIESSFGRKRLRLLYQRRSAGKTDKVTFFPEDYLNGKTNLLVLFGQYYNRHKTAQVRSQQG